MYQVSRLDNGLTILSATMPHMASVSVGIWVGVGGRHEPARLNGISHFIEHLLFKGTKRRNAAQISQAVEGIGGNLNAFTDEEHTCFYARAQHRYLPQLLDVLLDMFLNSKLDPIEIAKERTVIRDEISMYLDQPSEHVQDLLNALQFPRHPLGRPVIGTPRTLKAMKRQDFLNYQKTHYVSGSTLIVAAGRLDHQDLVRQIRKQAGAFRNGPAPGCEPAPEAPKQPRLRLLHKDTEQTHFSLGIRTCSRRDPRRYALRLLNVILGENMSSRLFQVIREENGLTYNIHSSSSFWDDCGDVVISAGLDTDELERTLKLIRRELVRLQEKAPRREELTRARDYLIGQHELQLEGTEPHMMLLGEHWLGFGSLPNDAEVKAKLAAVIPDDIRTAARDYFQPSRFSLALISPRKRSDDLLGVLGHG